MKIAVYAIAKNEELFVDRWYASCREADCVVVADTGSTDLTDYQLMCHDVILHDIAINPWRFDDARNAVLALVPHDVDVCIAMDLDEVLEPGWRQALEQAWVPGTNNAWINFEFNGETFAQNNRVHSRWGWRWKYPCHEALVSSRTTVQSVPCLDMLMRHLPDVTKHRPNYLELLAWGQWEEPTSTRMLHYYGRELLFQGHPKDAIERFEKYLELEPQNPFPLERAQTEHYLSVARDVLEASLNGVG
jgi:glycosyltransferase involved in cell wall biosynthesis